MSADVTNVVIAGLGGQGVLKASDILADVAFQAGCDVKKSEIHGMAQRGGSVSSDVRFGAEVLSPMVPEASADFVMVLSEDQVELNRRHLRDGGTLIEPSMLPADLVANRRAWNVALLGALSAHLPMPVQQWHEAIRKALPEKVLESNLRGFDTMRELALAARA